MKYIKFLLLVFFYTNLFAQTPDTVLQCAVQKTFLFEKPGKGNLALDTFYFAEKVYIKQFPVEVSPKFYAVYSKDKTKIGWVEKSALQKFVYTKPPEMEEFVPWNMEPKKSFFPVGCSPDNKFGFFVRTKNMACKTSDPVLMVVDADNHKILETAFGNCPPTNDKAGFWKRNENLINITFSKHNINPFDIEISNTPIITERGNITFSVKTDFSNYMITHTIRYSVIKNFDNNQTEIYSRNITNNSKQVKIVGWYKNPLTDKYFIFIQLNSSTDSEYHIIAIKI